MNLALSANHLSVTLAQRRVLTDLCAQFATGRWTCIVGPNGAGKSTLLKALAGLQPAQGEVCLLGKNLAQWPRRERAQTLAWMGQEETVADDLSVEDVVLLGRLPHQPWLAPCSESDRIQAQLAMRQMAVGAYAKRRLGDLSGGERQRVLLARALAVQAQVLLLDEPLAHLDMPHQVLWMRAVRGLVQQGITVISVVHELHIALHADDLLLVSGGEVVHHGPSTELHAHRALEKLFEHSFQIEAGQGACAGLRIRV